MLAQRTNTPNARSWRRRCRTSFLWARLTFGSTVQSRGTRIYSGARGVVVGAGAHCSQMMSRRDRERCTITPPLDSTSVTAQRRKSLHNVKLAVQGHFEELTYQIRHETVGNRNSLSVSTVGLVLNQVQPGGFPAKDRAQKGPDGIAIPTLRRTEGSHVEPGARDCTSRGRLMTTPVQAIRRRPLPACDAEHMTSKKEKR